MQQALDLVRHELGPDASVLHTRELNGGLVRRMVFGRQYEVAASTTVNVPSRLPARLQAAGGGKLGCRDWLSTNPLLQRYDGGAQRTSRRWPDRSACRK